MKLLKTVKKVWVLPVAAALIAGSGLTMNFILSSKSFAETGSETVPIQQQQTSFVQPEAKPAATEAAPEYTVIDQSETFTRDKLAESLKIKGAPEAELDSRVDEIQSTYVPGEKDITAEQAAAYSAGMLKKAFAASLDGYTARAGFLRGSLPGSDTWTVWFDPADPSASSGQRSYMVFLNSVNGTIINASSSDDLSALKNADLNDPEWREKAEQAVTALLPQNVSIRSSQVTAWDGLVIGVPVLCELSDGSAYMVGLAGDDKQVANLYFFQNGYDGSLDNSINKQKQNH